MDVMYLCNDEYAYIAGISILSLLDNNQEMDEINIYLVEDAIRDENLNRLSELVDSYKRKITFIKKGNIAELLGCNIEMHWWIENVFSRVLLSEVLKNHQEIKRLIYIDCDTLITGSLDDLWNVDLEDCIGAGVCEAMGNLHKKAIGLSKEDNYFNAGVFLINLDIWRTEKIDAQVKEFVLEKNGKLEYADESVLNGVLSKRLKVLSPKYNLTSLSVYFTSRELKIYRKSYFNYTEEERREALSDARIIHFTSIYLDNRPWVKGCSHPYVSMWYEYKEKSPWKDEALKTDNRPVMKQLAGKMAMGLPKKMRLMITGIMHAYVKPMKYIW